MSKKKADKRSRTYTRLVWCWEPMRSRWEAMDPAYEGTSPFWIEVQEGEFIIGGNEGCDGFDPLTDFVLIQPSLSAAMAIAEMINMRNHEEVWKERGI